MKGDHLPSWPGFHWWAYPTPVVYGAVVVAALLIFAWLWRL